MNGKLIDVTVYEIDNINYIELEKINFNGSCYVVLTNEVGTDTVMVKNQDGEDLLDVDTDTYYSILNLYIEKVKKELM